ncbi:hypothetical protein [Andreprevotia chitinilytica]|uniref:hypothetical protein n=1 Tax=Andreprevotia chitinilytica TaxID=396808 RepID=UPI00055419A8|nr:hypothetical protein [Andreprevotia chitinilytica]
MIRELSAVLLEMHNALQSELNLARDAGVPLLLDSVELTLPMQFQNVFADGQCLLCADVPRTLDPGGFDLPLGRMHARWERVDGEDEDSTPSLGIPPFLEGGGGGISAPSQVATASELGTVSKSPPPPFTKGGVTTFAPARRPGHE